MGGTGPWQGEIVAQNNVQVKARVSGRQSASATGSSGVELRRRPFSSHRGRVGSEMIASPVSVAAVSGIKLAATTDGDVEGFSVAQAGGGGNGGKQEMVDGRWELF